MQQSPLKTHSMEVLYESVTTVADRGTQLLENLEEYISESNSGLSADELDQLGLSARRCSRRFSVQELSDMFGLSRTTLHRFIDEGRLPERPVGVSASGVPYKLGYDIDDVFKMRKLLDKTPKVKFTAVMGFLNQKGGVGKSTLTWMFSQYLALLGYRVLVVDTDPQGTISFLYGYKARIDTGYWDTYVPFLLQDNGWKFDADKNVVIDENGFEEMVEELGSPEALDSLHYAVHSTHWPNIDIIPANNDLNELDLDPDKLKQARLIFSERTGKKVNNRIEFLRAGIDTVADDYDVILFDGTPSVNTSTMNVLSSCDTVVVPVPCSMVDYSSTIEFYSLIKTLLEAFMANSELKSVPVPQLFGLLTKFDKNSEPSRFLEKMILKTFREGLLSNYALQFTEIQKQSANFRSIYEINPSETNNGKALKESRSAFDAVFSEILTTVLMPVLEGRRI